MAESNLLTRLDAWLREHVESQERGLFPALIESMGASDAVCLHELTGESIRQHRALEAALRRAASGRTPVDELAASCRKHLAGEQSELLPMAARLLGTDEVGRCSGVQRLDAVPDR